MGIIPCGTGNDFAFALGIPKDPIAALNLILNGSLLFKNNDSLMDEIETLVREHYGIAKKTSKKKEKNSD